MPENTDATLNVTDIADLLKIVDYAAEQGAYRGWANIRQILAVRDRVEKFVASTTALNKPDAALSEAASAADSTPTGEVSA